MGSHKSCCVYGCNNTYSNTFPKISLYRFPKRAQYADRRSKWIHFAKRQNKDRTNWMPTEHHRICSAHFENGKKDDHPDSPSYLPKLYPRKNVPYVIPPTSSSLTRFDRRVSRSQNQILSSLPSSSATTSESQGDSWNGHNELPDLPPQVPPPPKYRDQCCQTVDALLDNKQGKMTIFISNINGQEASTQVDHECIEQKAETKHASVGTGDDIPTFHGYLSLELAKDGDTKMQELTSVSLNNFGLLNAYLVASNYKPRRYRTEDYLLIYLMKIKHGLTFRSLSIIFGIHPSTIRHNFLEVLNHLYLSTDVHLYWPTKAQIEATMPDCFRKALPNNFVRCIIDCTEIKCEKPSKVMLQNEMYSVYKSTHTIKVLLAVAPNGFISFLSKSFGGRCSDGMITNFSGFLDLLSPGDTVLADKGFPIITVEKVTTVMPPRKTKEQEQFTVEQLRDTERIASIRINVERVIQRLKIFGILVKPFPHTLLPHVDKILHVCACLVNLQAPIFKTKSNVGTPLTTLIEPVDFSDDNVSCGPECDCDDHKNKEDEGQMEVDKSDEEDELLEEYFLLKCN